MPLEDRIGNTAYAQASQSVREFVFLFQLQSLIMQSIGKALVSTLFLVMGKEAKIQNAQRNYSNVGSVCQQGPNKVKTGTGQPCFWHKKAVFDLN
jgi:hypothetical protein